MSAVNTIIDNALLMAQNRANLAQAYSEVAIAQASGFSRISPPEVDVDEVDEPNVSIPSKASGVDTAIFDSMYAQIIEDLAGLFRGFLADFFPDDQGLMSAVEAKLKSMIVDGGSGINPGISRQIWQRDRDRITVESISASEQAVGLWAARGYPMPPGAASAAVLTIAARKAEQVAAVSRDAAIKEFETEIENIKFAIAQAVDYRTKAIAAAADYVKALAVAPSIASEMSTQSADAQAKLISSVSSYYNARTNAADLVLKGEMFNADAQIKASIANQETDAKYAGLRVDSAVAAANSIGQQAAASLNGLNATAQLIESVDE
jgi:hypothetical protein